MLLGEANSGGSGGTSEMEQKLRKSPIDLFLRTILLKQVLCVPAEKPEYCPEVSLTGQIV